jgi:hypothetical protein
MIPVPSGHFKWLKWENILLTLKGVEFSQFFLPFWAKTARSLFLKNL